MAFIRTPVHLRYRLHAPEHQKDEEYAELYTRRERVKYAVVGLVSYLSVAALGKWWLFPALRAFSKVSICYEVGGISGTALLLYGVFIGMPAIISLVVGVPIAAKGLRSIKSGQYPPPGTKTFKLTKIRRGKDARLIGYGKMFPLIIMTALTLWCAWQARELLGASHVRNVEHSKCTPGATENLRYGIK